MNLLREYIREYMVEAISGQVYIHGTSPASATEIQQSKSLRGGNSQFAYIHDPNDQEEHQEQIKDIHAYVNFFHGSDTARVIYFRTLESPSRFRGTRAVWDIPELPIEIIKIEEVST